MPDNSASAGPGSAPPPSACVALHVALLERAGYMRGAGAGRAHAAYRALVLALTGAYLLQEAAYAVRARRDLGELARVMFLLLCHVTALAKQLVLRADAARVLALVHSFDGSARGARGGRGARAAALERALAERARRFVCGYAGCAVLTCALWLLFALSRRARGLPVRFPFCTGVDTEPLPAFAAVLLYSFYVTTLVGIANTTMDAFMGTILYQCKTQLTILRYDLETLPERAAREVGDSGEGGREAALMRLFVECYHHYHKVTETAALFQEIFGGAILIQFGIGGWILCMAAYKLASLSALSIEFASMLLFLTCILTELFVYCYCGNELAVESDRIVWSVYAMSWEHTPPRFRRCLVLLMERARRPLRPAAGRVVPLSLDTFLKILKSSYTFYAVLRQTK
ncbi:odorant receptor Or2-like [Bicyclus anynana]|uniref:Odorant receptor n=1 Tax=Bicyclus anynana TaxID=110368 RepID=A0A6J1P5J3_BICAN|nr:odorant receptor Or2-like [Bicyclus anynana]